MARRAFVDSIIEDPAKTFTHGPTDVLRDRRFTPQDRVDILEAWDRKDPGIESIILALSEAREKLPKE